MSRVVLAMSGGVDSSVAAHLLLEQGHEVIGLFMRHGHTVGEECAVEPTGLPILSDRAGHKQGCCSASDAADARRVAARLDIPFYALNFEAEFGRIMDYFVDEYSAGRTPNPCVVCNNWLKFGRLLDYADDVGAEFVATGHYARVEPASGTVPPALRRGLDGSKDQSYVLFGIAPEVLRRILLPVGVHTKDEIRSRAQTLGLRVADKKDSQEICFVTRGHYGDFIRQRRPEVSGGGEIVTTDGTVVGEHGGIENFTIGQRKGLGVAFGEPRYVVRLEAETQRVVIGQHAELAQGTLTADRANWLCPPPADEFRADVKIRYLAPAVPATVRLQSAEQFSVEFDQPQYGVAPGQAAVCYQEDRVLGGGWIR